LLIPNADDSAKVATLTFRNEFIVQNFDPIASCSSKLGEHVLQVGTRFLPASNTYRHGQVVDIEFLYRSTTNHKIPVILPASFQFEKVEGIRLKPLALLSRSGPMGLGMP
jgi:hypothetical protein